MIDYTIHYKDQLPIRTAWPDRWDVFISAYVPSERVKRAFEKADAITKWWLVFSEYGMAPEQLPDGNTFAPDLSEEDEFISQFWSRLPTISESTRICVDITGFIRPYLMYFVKWLHEKGVRKFDAVYSEPIQYKMREQTEFSGTLVREVRQVAGYEGVHTTDTSTDLLIIGSGYEDHLIKHVADNKAKARKLQLIGFPSLRADMYQENILRVQRAEESLGGCVDDETHAFFAPANDPFVSATKLSVLVSDLSARGRFSNLYLCPISTKPHVLGFCLFYLWEMRSTSTSIIFPFEESYRTDASLGIARFWKYTVELPIR